MKNNIILIIIIVMLSSAFIIGLTMIGRDVGGDNEDRREDIEPFQGDVEDQTTQYEGEGVDLDEVTDIPETIAVEEQTPAVPSDSMLDEHSLYVSKTCPHCHNVLNYIDDHQIDEKIVIKEYEIYNNPTNKNNLQITAAKCGLASYGVPLMWDGQNCYVGGDQITNYFDSL